MTIAPRMTKVIGSARGKVTISAGLLLLAAALLTTVSPWPLILVVLMLSIFAIASRTTWTLAIGAGLLGLLAVTAVFMQVVFLSGAPLDLTAGTLLVCIGALSIYLLWRSGSLHLPDRAARILMIPPLIVPLGALVALAISSARGQLGLSWAMRNDAVWNLVTARFVIEDGGILTEVHQNASPLTPSLIAIASSFGRSTVGASELLRHDVARAAEMWILLAVVSAALAGVIAVRMARDAAPALRIVGGIAASMIPLTWFTFGYALEFGFYNATLSLVVLLAVWLCWLEFPEDRVVATVALSAGVIAILATWGPLAAIVAPLLLVAIIGLARSRGSYGRRELILAGAGLAGAGLYGLAVTLPDLRRQNAALAADGGIFPIPPLDALIAVAVAALIVVAYSLFTRSSHLLAGFMSIAIGGLAGVTYLTFQRGSNAELWGYYPIKFTWIMLSVLLVLAVAVVFSATAHLRGRPLASLSLIGVSGIVIASVMWQAGPRFPPPVQNMLPVVNIAQGNGISSLNAAARVLFDIAADGERHLAFRLTDSQYDRFINFWLLQLESQSGDESIRKWAYFMNPEDDNDLCKALRAWRSPVIIYTKDAGLGDRLANSCEGPSYQVQLEQ